MDHDFPSPLVETHAAYYRFGRAIPSTPVVISVPHASRDYDAELLSASWGGEPSLARLEDRMADLLAHGLIAQGHGVIIARRPRAWLDLNRSEREIDPAMILDMPRDRPGGAGVKLRAGLGLIPRRIPHGGELWRGRMTWREVERRIEQGHRPYHMALEDMLRQVKAAFGQALLIDLHSMPPLIPIAGEPAPRIVLGDRFGRSASGRLTALAAGLFESRGLTTAQNHPYSGYYLLDRHGRPQHGIHAIQCEIDRSLYLDAALRNPGPGFAAMAALLAELGLLMAEELSPGRFANAAE